MVIQGCPWIITCNNFRQWTTINQTNWCYSATLTVAIFNLLCRLQTGLRTFKFIEAGNSHQQRHHFGDSSLECWSQSVSQCPLITSSCLPVNMESTNSLIFEDNNFKNSFMGAAFGASYNIHCLCIEIRIFYASDEEAFLLQKAKNELWQWEWFWEEGPQWLLLRWLYCGNQEAKEWRMKTTSEKGARPRNCKTRPYCPEWHSALIRSNTLQTQIQMQFQTHIWIQMSMQIQYQHK